jgi:hypothetical protein
MNVIGTESMVDIVFQLNWNSAIAQHTEALAVNGLNIWRDDLPGVLQQSLIGRCSGDRFSIDFKPGELLPGDAVAHGITLRRSQFDVSKLPAFDNEPRRGRFYPRGILRDVAGVFPQNMTPFRCIDVDNGTIQAAMAHPLTGVELTLSITVGSVREKAFERGGGSTSWIDRITDGVGMQARWENAPTDFFGPGSFARADERPDGEFYATPRLVDHIDRTARDMLSHFYRRYVGDKMRILDLMSSWRSHLPEEVHPERVVGIGLNAEELARNPALSEWSVQDLNDKPLLPFADGGFHAVLCSLSVEYLTDPRAVFKEAARVLAPGGVFVVAFSNRWFPAKTIQIWPYLHEFERMGLVLEYFDAVGMFERLGTYSLRGLPRPADDKYARERAFSDPVYAVWGVRRS